MSAGVSSDTGRISFGRLVTFGAIAGVLAAVANGVVYLLAAALGAMPEDVAGSGGAPITLLPVVLSSIMPAIVAAVFLALLGWFTQRPIGIFRVVAVALLVLSFITLFTIPGAPAAMILALLIMHVVAAAIIIWVLTTLVPRQS